MKILVLSYEAWNDITNGNNVTSNWFEGMDAEFANIYASPGEPYNQCCQRYYQITDSMMLKSIISGEKAGKEVVWLGDTSQEKNSLAEEEPQKLYRFLKSISGDWLRFLREVLWLWGKYDIEGMKKFIGNILFTSHDHELTQTVANRIIDIKADGKVIDREVTYNEYLGVE